jgi:hypothetical protein
MSVQKMRERSARPRTPPSGVAPVRDTRSGSRTNRVTIGSPTNKNEASESEAGSPPAERADEGVPDGRMHDGADARAGEDDGKREAASIVEPGRDDSRVDDRRIPRHGKTDHQKHRVKVPEIRREQGE